jgi:hypothetical protein
MRRIRAKLTYANVISSLALFLVLAGGSAVALNGSNTVSNDDVKDLRFVTLQLTNGWQRDSNQGTYAPSVAIDDQGVVHFRGAMEQATGTGNTAFRLPRAFRPRKNVYVPVYEWAAHPGGLFIFGQNGLATDGIVEVSAQDYSFAQQFTSLDGASFSLR